MDKKYLAVSIVVAITVSSIFAFSLNESQPDPETSVVETQKGSLLIKTDPWPPFNILFVAQEKGIFEKNGVEVEFDIQDYGAESMEVYSQEDFDGIMHAYTDIFTMNEIYEPSQVVYAADFSTEGDFIISNLDSLEKLKGKKVGINEMYGFSYFFVIKALQGVTVL